MNKISFIACMLLAFLGETGLLVAQEEPVPFRDDCIFYLSFDKGDPIADLSAGEPGGTAVPADKKAVFQKGLRGQALLLGGESATGVNFKSEGNFSYLKPGSISMWIQPVKWKRGEELPKDPEREDGHRLVTYSPFFMVNSAGSIGIERGTSVYLQGENAKDFMIFYSYGFPKVQNFNVSSRTQWLDGEWHHILLTWKGEEIHLYLDGKNVGNTTMKGKIEEYQPTNFTVGCISEPTLIDEVSIYSRALSEKDAQKLFDSFKK